MIVSVTNRRHALKIVLAAIMGSAILEKIATVSANFAGRIAFHKDLIAGHWDVLPHAHLIPRVVSGAATGILIATKNVTVQNSTAPIAFLVGMPAGLCPVLAVVNLTNLSVSPVLIALTVSLILHLRIVMETN